jgi:hypothetical protein
MSYIERHPLFPQFAMALILVLWCLSGGCSAAEVQLSGTPDRIVMRTNDATITEILAAFRARLGLEMTLRGTMTHKFTGAYSGSVRQVFSRLLTGEDYIFSTTSNGMSIVLLGNSAADAAARPVPQPPTLRPPVPQNAGLPR